MYWPGQYLWLGDEDGERKGRFTAIQGGERFAGLGLSDLGREHQVAGKAGRDNNHGQGVAADRLRPHLRGADGTVLQQQRRHLGVSRCGLGLSADDHHRPQEARAHRRTGRYRHSDLDGHYRRACGLVLVPDTPGLRPAAPDHQLHLSEQGAFRGNRPADNHPLRDIHPEVRRHRDREGAERDHHPALVREDLRIRRRVLRHRRGEGRNRLRVSGNQADERGRGLLGERGEAFRGHQDRQRGHPHGRHAGGGDEPAWRQDERRGKAGQDRGPAQKGRHKPGRV